MAYQDQLLCNHNLTPKECSQAADLLDRLWRIARVREAVRGEETRLLFSTSGLLRDLAADAGYSPEAAAPDAVMSAMETETDPLPDAVASAWDTELNPPPKATCNEEAQAIQQIADNMALASQIAKEGRRAKKRP